MDDRPRYMISVAAELVGMHPQTLRMYEQKGLVRPQRTAGNTRLYSEADLHRVEFIKQAKALGLTLEQVRELAVASRERACAMTRSLLLKRLDERINQTAQQILTLKRLKRELEHRQEALARRPPTDHGRGYCGCLEDGKLVAPGLVKINLRTSARSGVRERR